MKLGVFTPSGKTVVKTNICVMFEILLDANLIKIMNFTSKIMHERKLGSLRCIGYFRFRKRVLPRK